INMMDTWIPLQQIQTPNLQNNLQYLQSRSHEVLRWLQKPYESESLVLQQEGSAIRCRTAVEPPQWIMGEQNANQEITALRETLRINAPQDGVWVIIGGAAGYAAAEAMSQVIAKPDLRVVVIEPTPARLIACLTLVDLRSGLATERLHFAVAPLDHDSISAALSSYNLYTHGPFHFTISPECDGLIDLNELNEMIDAGAESWKQERESLLIQYNSQSQSEDVIRSVLIVNCWQNAPGELHLKSIEKYLNEWGVKTHWLTLNRYRMDAAGKEYQRLAEPLLLEAFQKAQPDLVISYGYHAPQFVSESVFEKLPSRWVQAVSNIAYYDHQQYAGELCVPIEENLIPIFEKRNYSHCFFQP
ncbi:hypothetical protein K8I31_06855, partial [bacterium]|nr:hypothetical protein [bacterium]